MSAILQEITVILIIASFGFGLTLIGLKVEIKYKVVSWLVWMGLFSVLFTAFIT